MTNKYDTLIQAIDAGANMAGNLKTGDKFIGAMEAAIQFYPADSKEYQCFISGYIAALNTTFPDGIKCQAIGDEFIIQ